MTGGELYEVAQRYLADPFFGVHLNPGHFIHLDEWPSSPVYAGSSVSLQSGMALQLDIIPATGTVYHTSNIEDGVALADAALRAELASRYPGMWQRVRARRAFMADVAGDSAEARGAAAVEPGGVPAAVLAVAAAGHAAEVS